MRDSRYRDWHCIGEGAYGVVYWAYDTIRQQAVAIKKSALPAWQEKHGAQLLAKLEHPDCPKVLDHFEDAQYYYLVMTYCEGIPLTKRSLKHTETRRLIRWLLEILDLFSQSHILYNDFKPDNILMDQKGRFYLIDFGASSCSDDQQAIRYGSRAYASPEYLRGAPIDWRSDLYSVAKTAQAVCCTKDLFLEKWLAKASQTAKQKRFKSIADARFALFWDRRFLLILLHTTVLFWLLSYPVQRLCYDWSLTHGQLYDAVAIDRQSSEAFYRYLQAHDPFDLTCWQVLWQWGISQTSDEQLLWLAEEYLAWQDSETAWKMLVEICLQDENRETDQFSMAIQKSDLAGLQSLLETSRDPHLHRLVYAFVLYGKVQLGPRWMDFVMANLKAETVLDSRTCLLIETRLNLQSGQIDALKKSFVELAKNELFAWQAYVAIRLFDAGYYQENWLKQAVLALDRCKDNEWTKKMRDQIAKRRLQWGDQA